MATRELDAAKAEAFAGTLLGILNGGATSLFVSIGHQTGLLDAMAELEPATSEEIAAATGLNERYVREWLAGLTVSGVIEHHPEAGTYALPPEHAACMTRAAGPDNLASFAQYIGLFAEVEQDVVECFRHGGGVPYARFPRFQRLMAEESAQVNDAVLVDVTLPLVPGLVERLRAGIDVLDVGCGSGHAVNLMANAFPESRCTGYDFSEEGIAAGRAEAAQLSLTNARFELRDVTALDEPGGYGLVTAFDVVHDTAAPERLLAGIASALAPGGVFLMVDIAASSHVHENVDHPLGPALYAASLFHCMTVSLAQDGAGLGTMWGEQKALELLAAAGFADVEVKHVEGDILNSYYVARKEAPAA